VTQIKDKSCLTLSSEEPELPWRVKLGRLRLVFKQRPKKGARGFLGEFLMQLAIALPTTRRQRKDQTGLVRVDETSPVVALVVIHGWDQEG